MGAGHGWERGGVGRGRTVGGRAGVWVGKGGGEARVGAHIRGTYSQGSQQGQLGGAATARGHSGAATARGLHRVCLKDPKRFVATCACVCVCITLAASCLCWVGNDSCRCSSRRAATHTLTHACASPHLSTASRCGETPAGSRVSWQSEAGNQGWCGHPHFPPLLPQFSHS